MATTMRKMLINRLAEISEFGRNFQTCYFRKDIIQKHLQSIQRGDIFHYQIGKRSLTNTHYLKCEQAVKPGITSFSRSIPKSKEEVQLLLEQPVKQPPNPHVLVVALLGTPNTGKSTLTNQLMGWRVCSVSRKVHTTRHKTKAVFIDGSTQIVFLDTPGLISPTEKKKYNLEHSLLVDPAESLKTADIIMVLMDVANKWNRYQLDPKIIKLLHQYREKESILVLNKIDLLKSKSLLLDITNSLTKGKVGNSSTGKTIKKATAKTPEILISQNLKKIQMKNNEDENSKDIQEIDQHTGWPNFQEVFMIAAVNGDGVQNLKNYLIQKAKPGPWQYPASIVTDQTPEEIVIMAVREKLLNYLPQEIPYTLKLEIEMWEVDHYGILRIVVLVGCKKNGFLKLIIGPKGQKIAKIAEEARQELMNTFRCEVSLKLIVNQIS